MNRFLKKNSRLYISLEFTEPHTLVYKGCTEHHISAFRSVSQGFSSQVSVIFVTMKNDEEGRGRLWFVAPDS